MSETYSTYEAKAKLSEILRKVEAGRTVVISRHGRAIAEVRPAPRSADVAERIEELARQGVVVTAPVDKAKWKRVARRPGALRRFLEDRNE